MDPIWNLIVILPHEDINKFCLVYFGHIPESNLFIPFLIAKLLIIVS